jgi:hypothetical protein
MTNEEKCEEIHRLLSSTMLDILRNGRQVVTQDGTVQRVTPTSSDLNAIRGFLKDHGINAVRTRDNPLNDLVAEMTKRAGRITAADLAGGDDGEGQD